MGKKEEKFTDKDAKKFVEAISVMIEDSSLSNKEVANKVELPASSLSRLLSKARDMGYYSQRIQLNIPEEYEKYLPNRTIINQELKIIERFKKLSNLKIVDERNQYNDAAGYIENIIIESTNNYSEEHRFLISSGYTVQRVVKSFNSKTLTENIKHQVFPLKGDYPFAKFNKKSKVSLKEYMYFQKASANSNSSILSRLIQSDEEWVIRSTGVVYSTSDKMADDIIREAKHFLNEDICLRHLYGDFFNDRERRSEEGIANMAHTLITSSDIKPPELSESFMGDKNIELPEGYFGNVSGVEFRLDKKTGQKEQHSFMERKNVGFGLSTLENISKRYREDKASSKRNNVCHGGGVVLLSFSNDKHNNDELLKKAELTAFVVDSGYVNTLILNDKMANALIEVM